METKETKTDKAIFDFSVSYKNRNNNSFNYAKIAESLKISDFKKAIIFAGLLTEKQVNEIVKNPDAFIKSLTKHDDFSPEKKKFRKYGQDEPKICEMLEKKGIDTNSRKNNYKYIMSFCY